MSYPVILADPPWHFQNWAGDTPNQIVNRGYGAQSQYPTMSTDDICNLEIPAAGDAALFLWAVWPMLPDAMRVIEAWGFTFKTIGWVWAKLNPSSMGFYMGMGYYTRSNTEPCLLAIRGKMPVKEHDVQALIVSPVQAHSRKPDDQYRKIERLYDGPYLELFARRKRAGWHSWGNEVESDVVLEATP